MDRFSTDVWLNPIIQTVRWLRKLDRSVLEVYLNNGAKARTMTEFERRVADDKYMFREGCYAKDQINKNTRAAENRDRMNNTYYETVAKARTGLHSKWVNGVSVIGIEFRSSKPKASTKRMIHLRQHRPKHRGPLRRW